MEIKTLVQIIAFLLGSAVVGTLISNVYSTRLKRKELVAEATKSALKRIEVYYRILRRTDDKDDALAIRDLFHSIQEENDYYQALMSIESVWLGHAYSRFISALKRSTGDHIKKAWKGKAYGASAELEKVITLNNTEIQKYISRFTLDSKRLFNPPMRLLMRIRYMFREHIKDDGYGTK